ncbi:unnamed protein product, partial [Discosporangium mesarthrocarpum]
MIQSRLRRPRGSSCGGLSLGRAPRLGLVMLLTWANRDAADTITVVAPGSRSVGETFTVAWIFETNHTSMLTTGDFRYYDIDLHSGRDCVGIPVSSLCNRGDGIGCADRDGKYNVTIPDDTTPGEYSLRVGIRTRELSACSATFAVEEVAASTGPTLTVLSPGTVVAGKPFTAKWDYDDGDGGREGYFHINLHECAAAACTNGGCGSFVSTLCQNPEGCYDPLQGDYDVVIPKTTKAGTYKLVVQSALEQGPEDCNDLPVTVEGTEAATPSPVTLTAPPLSSPMPASTIAPTLDLRQTVAP